MSETFCLGQDQIRIEGDQVIIDTPVERPEWQMSVFRKTIVIFQKRRYFLADATMDAAGTVRYILKLWPENTMEIPGRVVEYNEITATPDRRNAGRRSRLITSRLDDSPPPVQQMPPGFYYHPESSRITLAAAFQQTWRRHAIVGGAAFGTGGFLYLVLKLLLPPADGLLASFYILLFGAFACGILCRLADNYWRGLLFSLAGFCGGALLIAPVSLGVIEAVLANLLAGFLTGAGLGYGWRNWRTALACGVLNSICCLLAFGTANVIVHVLLTDYDYFSISRFWIKILAALCSTSGFLIWGAAAGLCLAFLDARTRSAAQEGANEEKQEHLALAIISIIAMAAVVVYCYRPF